MDNNKKEIKLHLGSAKKYIPGFVHIDLDRSPKIDYYHDIATLPMFKNNTVDIIYCCHAFEYFDRYQAKKVLKEWKRVLKKGGVLRLAVPDFQNINKVYLKYKDLDHRGILGPLFGRWEIKDKKGNKKWFYHKTAYDFKSLENFLEEAGFKKIRRYDWGKTIHKDYDDYSMAYIPHMDKKNGILISLNVEAEK